jgi:YYY domain-containing protein
MSAMFFDWLATEGSMVLAWWALVSLAGIAVLPLCWRLLSALPDKGYTLARGVGLLLVGFVFWLLASLGFLRNTAGSMIFAWGLVFALSLFIYLRWRIENMQWRDYWRENRWLMLATEILFFALFFGWSIFRAYQNDTATTEKPMELAFISGIMRSETFPPLDPWMSGYAISYYYFGYVMSAMLSTLSGVGSAIGFSLTNALLFALSGLMAFGVTVNLVRAYMRQTQIAHCMGRAIITGILALVFVTLIGNFQLPLIEAPYQSRSMSAEYFEFWGTQARSSFGDGNPYQQVNDAYTVPAPSNMSYWWWFRASRVLTDYNLDGTVFGGAQPIDEFPQFSFILGDNHPHVLALPFAILMLGLALNLLLKDRAPNRLEIAFYGIAIGGLIFLNTWDGPIYLIALVGAEALRRLIAHQGRLMLEDWLRLVLFGLQLLLIAVVAYLPFFIGFRSQASGILPNIIHPTLFRRYFIMFGPLLLLFVPYLLLEARRGQALQRLNWRLGFMVGLALTLVLVSMMVVMMIRSTFVPSLQAVVQGFVQQYGGWEAVLPLVLQRRVEYGLTGLLLLLTIILVVARLFPRRLKRRDDESLNQENTPAYVPATGFVLLLIGIGATLTFVPEFVYLRDNFGSRINTVFKFYYQAWLAFSLVSAFAVYRILLHPATTRASLARFGRGAYAVIFVVVLVAGLMYPVYGIYHRAMIETGRADTPPERRTALTLDGAQRMISQDEYAAVMCLNDVVGQDVTGIVVAEASEQAYNPTYGRVGTITGIPILLGWPNHQRQWRGATYGSVAGTRQQDLERLYNDMRWESAQEIITRYGIDYIVFGQTERTQYEPLGEEKFQENLELICDFGNAHIYRVPS